MLKPEVQACRLWVKEDRSIRYIFGNIELMSAKLELSWSDELAYIVGLIATDGNLSKDGRHINFTSKDIDQIRNFSKILKLKSKIGIRHGAFSPSSQYYYIQFSHIRFYRFLKEVGLTPNKTFTLGELKIPDKFFADFLRGHLDGDGYTYSYWDKRYPNSFMIYTVFVSASLLHAGWIQRKIRLLFDLNGRLTLGKRAFRLIFAKKASVKLLTIMYSGSKKTSLKRKNLKIWTALGIIARNAGVEKSVNSLP